jgi:hypothetical protein
LLRRSGVPSRARDASRRAENIVATFGDINRYIRPDGSLDAHWREDSLVLVNLPFRLRLAWDHTRTVSRMTCHHKMAQIFASVFGQIQSRDLQAKITSFGGCFSFRRQRTGAPLSTHSWGIAVDLNPETNPQGSSGDMDAGIVEVFRAAGFEWGGDWTGKTRDPMHFQFCTGY